MLQKRICPNFTKKVWTRTSINVKYCYLAGLLAPLFVLEPFCLAPLGSSVLEPNLRQRFKLLNMVTNNENVLHRTRRLSQILCVLKVTLLMCIAAFYCRILHMCCLMCFPFLLVFPQKWMLGACVQTFSNKYCRKLYAYSILQGIEQ